MSVNRENAKIRGLKRDLEREKSRRLDAEIVLGAIMAFIGSDNAASEYQTLGQYRTAMLRLFAERKPTPDPS